MAPSVSAALRRAPLPVQRAGRRVAVVLNARARHVTREVIEQARELLPSTDLFISGDLAAARDIARTVVETGYDAVLAGGGDGTFTRCVTDVHAAAAQLGLPAPAVGVLRLGTGNAVADAVGVGADRSPRDVVA